MSLVFQLGPYIQPVLAAVDELTQRYEPIGGEHLFRTASGRGIKQTTWAKTRVVTAGGGWVPAGLQALDYRQSMILRCVVPQAVHLPAGVLTAPLPPARRNDAGHRPWGHALLPGGAWLPTTLVMDGDTATLAPVPGALSYAIQYFPELLVWAMRPEQAGDRLAASHRWDMVCEEV